LDHLLSRVMEAHSIEASKRKSHTSYIKVEVFTYLVFSDLCSFEFLFQIKINLSQLIFFMIFVLIKARGKVAYLCT